MITLQPLTLDKPTAKRKVRQPDLSTLTDGQLEGFNLFREFIEDDLKRYFVLEGWAGTGKSYLSSFMVEHLLFNAVDDINIAMTAPVHDAVKVLKNSTQFKDDRLHFGTLHSLLGLKQHINKKTGQQEFKKDFKKDCRLDVCNYLVIDEGSMLDNFLFGIIHSNYALLGRLKVIIIGDGGQIPPVNHPYSIPFSTRGREKYNMVFFELSQIVRQAEGSPIIGFTSTLRANQDKRRPITNVSTNMQDNKGLLQIDSKDSHNLLTTLNLLFNSEQFKKDPNYCKVICWRNKWTSNFNRAIRQLIYKTSDLPKFMEGEKLIANSAILEGEAIVASNRTRFEVLKIQEDKVHVMDGYSYKCYFLDVVVQDYDSDKELTLKVIHQDDEARLKNDVSNLFKTAYAEPDIGIRGKIFERAHYLTNYFADVGYNYAITAHKSQGSTYQYALVAVEDIYSTNPYVRVTDRNKIGYTACTRPKDVLIILGKM